MKVMDIVYICKIDEEILDDERYNFLYNKLPDERKRKVNKYIFKQDKVQSLISYLLFVVACKRAGIYFTEKDILYSVYGKPYFQDGKNIHFNISNCRSGVCCGISAYPIGVDVESVITQVGDLVDLCMHPNEIEKIGRLRQNNELFTKYWTLKESFLKCQGIGLNGDMRLLDFSRFSQCSDFYIYGKNFHYFQFDNLHTAVCSIGEIICDEINITQLEKELKDCWIDN